MRILVSFFLLAVALSAAAQQPTLKTTEVAPGLVMISGEGGFVGGNLGLLTGDDGVVLIDDLMPPFGDMMLEAIAEQTGMQVDYVINTHIHGDHVGNNKMLSDGGTEIVAHKNIRKRMLEVGVALGGGNNREAMPGELPTITYSKMMTFHVNGRTAHVIHTPKAHTDGDSFVHFPGVNVIHTGDLLFNGLFPYIDLDSGGSVAGYIAGQQKMLSLADDDTVIMSGHGPVASKADLQRANDMLVEADRRVGSMLAEGKSGEEILAANPLADFHDDWNWGFITTEVMTQTLIRAHSGN